MSDPSKNVSQKTDNGNDSGSNTFRTNPSEDREPLLPELTTSNIESEPKLISKDAKGKAPEARNQPRTRRRRPRKHRHHSDSTVQSAEAAIRLFQEKKVAEERAVTIPQDSATRHQPAPLFLRRTSSNFGVDEKLHPDAVAATPMHEGQYSPNEQLTHKSRTKRPWRLHRSRKASPPVALTEPGSPVIEFKWSPVRNRSNSDSAPMSQPKPRTLRLGKDIPLKPSLKSKSKSTTTTPPTEQVLDLEAAQERQKLRKVKTVEFQEKVSQQLLSLPPLKLWAEECKIRSSPHPQHQSIETRPGRFHNNPRDTLRRTRSCLAPKTKAEPASAAITRTDVHVVAVTPSPGPPDIAEPDSMGQPPTPTMQIVESKTGRYEVIWDDVADVQPKHDLRSHRRSSSASQSLHAAASSTSKGLERVSSKLSEWSGEGGPASTQFTPQVVVVPDDDCRTNAPMKGFILDDDTLPILTPPNSVTSAAAASRQSSGPASARTSRPPSHDTSRDAHISDSDIGALIQRHATHKAVSDKIVCPASPSRLKEASNHGLSNTSKKKPLINRRLSNLEDSDVHFRDHRDSVTLARDRFVPSSRLGPEDYMRRDSASKAMAKKRLRAPGAANSIFHKAVYTNGDDDELLLPAVAVELSTPAKSEKTSAVKSLKNSASASMFRERETPRRHIRIME